MLRSYILLILCVTFWGSNYVFSSILVQEFPPLLLTTARLTVSSLFFTSYLFLMRKWIRLPFRDLRLLVTIGTTGILINQTSFFTGIQTTDATTAALIHSLAPITTALLASILLRETLSRRMLGGSVVALIGVFFILGKGGSFHISLGIALMFVAMLSFCISIILIRKLTDRLDSFIVTAYSTIIGLSLMVPVTAANESLAHLSRHPWAWGLLILSALGSQVVSGLIWNHQMRRVGAAKASVFLNLQPFVTMLVGFLLLGTTVTSSQAIGSMLVVGGVVLATYQVRRQKDAPMRANAVSER